MALASSHPHVTGYVHWLTEINALSGWTEACAGGEPLGNSMPPHHNLCFVIADGGHARFIRPAADNAPHTFEEIDSDSVHERAHDLVSDRSGRAFESGSSTRHAYTARVDPHEQEKTRFAHAVGSRIKELSEADTFQELVLVAPSPVLSELVDMLDQPMKAKLVGSLAKDLVKVPDHELSSHLKEWVRPVRRA